ncbi:MAG: type 4a pilus biogenesis protein PilO [Gallionella sp.]
MKQKLHLLGEQLGWQGIMGIALLILAWMFLMMVLMPLEQKTKSMQSQLDKARSIATKRNVSSDLSEHQYELNLFFESLPVERDVTDILASIDSIAEESGLELKQVEYKLNDKDSPILEYGMVFSIQGEYGKIRYFVSHVLAKNPAISLDQINFQRDKISDLILTAEIRLTLFLHGVALNP